MSADRGALPLIEARGRTHYQIGYQHGHACGDLIARYPEILLHVVAGEATLRGFGDRKYALTRDDLRRRALHFLPRFEQFAPHLVEELRGIADGARLPFEDVLLVNVRAEVAGLSDGACTAFAIGRSGSMDGSVIAGQNLDQDPQMVDLGIVLKVVPDHGPSILMMTFAGLVGYPGINSAGVTTFQNAVSTPVWKRDAMPHYIMKRVLLEQESIDGCLSVFDRARVCSSGNYVLADRTGRVADVELTPDGYAVVESRENVVTHCNHFVSARFIPEEALLPSIPDSTCRLDRISALIGHNLGRITVDTMKLALSDHDGWPTSICRHDDPRMKTIASIIAEPDAGRLHVSVGNPCENAYETYSL